ncbi:MAG: hypothetical protein M5U09_07940 [Gammaproteobacteria bacterium]|nr:hypothetical protein [Gammaproteobacteria bacterium]
MLYSEGAGRIHVLDGPGSSILSRLLEGASRAHTAARLAGSLGIDAADAATMVHRVHEVILVDRGAAADPPGASGAGEALTAGIVEGWSRRASAAPRGRRYRRLAVHRDDRFEPGGRDRVHAP